MRAAITRQVCLIANDATDCPPSPAELKAAEHARAHRRAARDTDHDGVPDVVERRYGTDPRRADSDGDGRGDAYEIRHGTVRRPLARAAQRGGGEPEPVEEGGEPEPNGGKLSKEELRQRALRTPVTPPRFTTIPNGGGVMRTEGVDEFGRPVRFTMRARPSALKAPRDNRRITPKGFEEARQAGLRPHRTHLGPREFGAPGDDAGNMYVAPARFNQSTIRALELRAKAELVAGNDIYLEEVPIYVGREMIPRSVQVNLWRTVDGKDELVTGECVSVWPDGKVPPNVPLGKPPK
jgi:DNA/RNA non-specific endonuclease/Bacterial TSP3 repeat